MEFQPTNQKKFMGFFRDHIYRAPLALTETTFPLALTETTSDEVISQSDSERPLVHTSKLEYVPVTSFMSD